MPYVSLKPRGRTSKFVLCPAVLTLLPAALLFRQVESAHGRASSPVSLTGAAARAYLEGQGLDARLAQRAKLTATDGAENDELGSAVAVSGDTAVIGAHTDDIEGDQNQGSAYVFVRQGGGWSLQQELTAIDGRAGDLFGRKVAVSGDTIVVGAYPAGYTTGSPDQGAAYVFERTGTRWAERQKLTAGDGAAQLFGTSVALSGETLVVGARSAKVGANDSQGAAYVFVRSGATWAEQQKLTAKDGEANDHFGAAVALERETVVIGADGGTTGTKRGQGAAYIFARSGTTWAEQQKLVAGDGAAQDQFGAAIALSGETLIVGAPSANARQGAAYAFVRAGAVWTEQRKLTPNDPSAGDNFGIAVALNGDLALIGSYLDGLGGNTYQGSAYLFRRAGAAWSERQKLTSHDGAANDVFGASVALSGETAVVGAPGADGPVRSETQGPIADQGAAYIFGCGFVEQQVLSPRAASLRDEIGLAVAVDGDTAVVGAPGFDDGTVSNRGTAYVFVRRDGVWAEQAQLAGTFGYIGDEFGRAVAIAGNTIVVGAPLDDFTGRTDNGTAYVFVRSGTTWREQTRLSAADGANGDLFGAAVAISGDRVAVGAYGADVDGKADQGAVYLFTRAGGAWTPEIKRTANDGASGDLFGRAVALDRTVLLAGAPSAKVGNNEDQGAAYVFGETVAVIQTPVKLTAADGAANECFGSSVALDGGTALVGAPQAKVGTNDSQGAAYVFVNRSTPIIQRWPLQAKLTASDGLHSDLFGWAVSLSDDTAVVGAIVSSFGVRRTRETTYVFARSDTRWTEQQQLTFAGATPQDSFGAAVSIDGDTILVGAPQFDTGKTGLSFIFQNNCPVPLPPLSSVSAASYAATQLAPESIAAGFGGHLADAAQAAVSLPLPTALADVRVLVRDSAGTERPAPLFFVSPNQINYLIPAGTLSGPATVTVKLVSDGDTNGVGNIMIGSVAPGLFTANSNGQGVAAALALRVKADGAQSFEPVAQFDAGQNRFVAAAVDLGPETDQVFLVLYGTGIRLRSALGGVSATIGGLGSEVLFADAAPGFVGLDQVNVRLPRALAGRGEVDVALSVDGRAANVVRVSIR